jgi:hypothetical protein
LLATLAAFQSLDDSIEPTRIFYSPPMVHLLKVDVFA